MLRRLFIGLLILSALTADGTINSYVIDYICDSNLYSDSDRAIFEKGQPFRASDVFLSAVSSGGGRLKGERILLNPLAYIMVRNIGQSSDICFTNSFAGCFISTEEQSNNNDINTLYGNLSRGMVYHTVGLQYLCLDFTEFVKNKDIMLIQSDSSPPC